MRRVTHHHELRALGLLHVLDVAQPARHRNDVDRGIAAADHHHAAGDRLEAALVEGLEKRDSADTVGRVRSRNGQAEAGFAADREQHRVEVGFEVVQVNFDADARVEPDLDAHRDDAIDLTIQMLARQTVARHTVLRHAPQLGVIVEQRDRMPFAAQLIGGREACRATAHDRNALAGIGPGLEGEVLLQRIVADVLLDRVDANVVFHGVAIAAGLAGRRAHPPHHRGKRIGGGRAAERVLLHARALGRLLHPAHDVEPAADVLPRRTARLAGRRLVHVGRALVGFVGREDLFPRRSPFVVAVLESANGACALRLGLARRY